MKAAVILLMSALTTVAQERLSFEVASVKRNRSDDGRVILQPVQPGGRLTMTNVPLRQLILRAYQIQDFQLDGAPGWIESERYDVAAVAPKGSSQGQVNAMLRDLLADRFHLATHTAQKETTVFALVLARKDGTLGPKMKPSTADCGPGLNPPGPPSGRSPEPERTFGQPPLCGMRISPFSLLAGGTPIAALVNTFSRITGKTVVDRTGLSGAFDVTLIWTPDESPFVGPPPPGVPPPIPYDPNGPPLAVALQDQLGLKLETQKGPVDTVVIDRIDRPTEN